MNLVLRPPVAVWTTPTSFAQERMWFLEQLNVGSAQYNIPVVIPFGRRCSRTILERTLAALIDRHEALRTGFVREGGTVSQLVSARRWIQIGYSDLRQIDPRHRERSLLHAMEAEAQTPFDDHIAPLVRATLYRVSSKDDRLHLVFHHIIVDAWSIDILLREFNEIYTAFENGRQPSLPPLRLQYADWAAWQRDQVEGAGLTYWRDALAGAPSVLELPTDLPRPATLSTRGDTQHALLPRALVTNIQRLAERYATSPFAIYFAAYAILLSRWSRADDLLIGCPMTMRNSRETEAIVGLFLNTLPLRADLSANPSVGDFIKQLREMAAGAQAHSHVPLDELIDLARPDRAAQRHPLFQTLFSYQAAQATSEPAPNRPGRSADPIAPPGTGTAKFELSLLISNHGSNVSLAWEYATDLFVKRTIVRMNTQFNALLEWLCDNVDSPIKDAVLMGEEERRDILNWESAGRQGSTAPQDSICTRFAHQAAKTPEATALICDGKHLTYHALADAVDKLAKGLVARGVKPDDCVGVFVPRDTFMVTAVLAILRVGAAYLPLALDLPEARLRSILKDATVRHVIAPDCLRGQIPSGVDVVNPSTTGAATLPAMPALQSVAYVLYTSGSTGQPKGVSVAHGSLAAFLDWAETEFSSADRARVLASTALSFDISVFELFLPLSTGGSIVLVDSILSLVDCKSPDITLINTVPSAMQEVLLRWEPTEALRAINVAGETLAMDLAAAIHAKCGPGVTLRNLYGPTETTIYSTFALIVPGTTRPPIGRPLPGTTVHVLDAGLDRCPIGVVGELYIAGDGVSLGYRSNPGLTAQSFLPDPFAVRPGQRMYKTGDLARWVPSGTLELVGRIDAQVKLRGFRIELTEIEAVLRAHPEVGEAVVLLDNTGAEPRLAAFVLGEARVNQIDLVQYLRQCVPDYMVPSTVEVLETVPRTTSGKIDRRALLQRSTAPELTTPTLESGDHVSTICQVFKATLGVQNVGQHDDFFALGGSSLRAVRVVAQIEAALGIPISLQALFAAPTPAALAELCRDNSHGVPQQILDKAPGVPEPLSRAQDGMFMFERLQPGTPLYNMQIVIPLEGGASTDHLQSALDWLFERHEALRLRFDVVDGTTLQWADASLRVGLRELHLRDASLTKAIAREVRRPFNLRVGPPLRATLIRTAAGEEVLLLVLHHLVGDGWSGDIIAKEFRQAFATVALSGVLPTGATPTGFLSFARWQRGVLDGKRYDEAISECRAEFARLTAPAALPCDRPRPARRSFAGGHVWLDMPEDLTSAVTGLAQVLKSTPSTIYLAAFTILLGRLSKQDRVAVGMPVLNRDRPEWQSTVGLFTNTVPLALPTQAENFADLCREVLCNVRKGLSRSWLPFDVIVEALNPPRIPGCNPLFQVMYAFQEVEEAVVVDQTARISTGTAKFDLSINVTHTPGGGLVVMEYASDMFDNESIERISTAYTRLLEAVVQAGDQTCASLAPFPTNLAEWCAFAQKEPKTLPKPQPLVVTNAPQSDAETKMSELWAEVLGHREFSRDSNFFASGGTSLTAIQLWSRATEMGFDLTAEDLFATPTIAALAAARGDDSLSQMSEEFDLITVDRSGKLPVSWAQERLLFLDALNPGAALYNVPMTMIWHERVQPAIMEAALEHLASRHEALRSRFVTSQDASELIIDSHLSVELGLSDLTRISQEAQAEELLRIQRRTVRRPFDLANDPLLRGHLVWLGPNQSALFLCLHHTVTDALSSAIIEGELREIYEAFCLGDVPDLPELEAQFVEYVSWQRRRLTEDARAQHAAFWHSHLEGAPPLIGLPTDFPRRAAPYHSGQQLSFALSAKTSEAVRSFAKEAGTTPFVVLLASFFVLLAAEAGEDDLVIGVPVSGRPHRAFEHLVGFFSNTLPLRVGLDRGASFAALVDTVRRSMAKVLRHQDLPFEEIVHRLNPERSSAWHPLFQTMFAYSTSDTDTAANAAVEAEPTDLLGTAKFDLTLFVHEASVFYCAFEFRSDLFLPASIKRFCSAFDGILVRALAQPQYPLNRLLAATTDDIRQIERFNATETTFAAADDVFAMIDLDTEHFIAIEEADGTEVTAADLKEQSARIAARLAARGVKPGDRVAIIADPTSQMIAAIVGVWHVGAAPVMIDPAYPTTRIDYMIADSGARVILGEVTRAPLASKPVFIDWRETYTDPSAPPDPNLNLPEDIAYVVYTSGSTGQPKPIAMTHAGLGNLVAWQTCSGSTKANKALQFSSPSFDVFFQEVCVTLSMRGTLCMIAPEIRKDPSRLLDACRSRGIQRLFLPYVALRELAEIGRDAESVPMLTEVITAGEQLQITPALRSWFARHPNCTLINHYGPAETHVVTEERLLGDPATWPDLPSIGRPIANCHAHVLSADGTPCPIGVAGELFLSGTCVAQGYLGRPELTVERFLTAQTQIGATWQRAYRTGDRARWLHDGRLVYLGRNDDQVKIRGHRVELAEIETALHALDGVAQAVVVVRSEPDATDAQLVAFVVPKVGARPLRDLRALLAETLPEPLIPSRFVEVDSFKRTPSGKIDRQALHDFAPKHSEESKDPCDGGAIAREGLAEIWRKVLGLNEINEETSFFASGGHSLNALRLIRHTSEHLGHDVPLSAIFDYPRFGDFLRFVGTGSGDSTGHVQIETLPRDGTPLPASSMQRRLWLQAQIAPGDPAYNLSRVVWLEGRPDRAILRDAIRWLAERHEVLRTRFDEREGKVVQVITDAASVPIEVFPMDAFSPQDAQREVAALVEEEAQRGFDLASDPLFRVIVATFADHGAAVLISMHHAISDGRTLNILERDLTEAYTAMMDGALPPRPPLHAQFAEFANLERSALDVEAADLLNYWTHRIEDTPTHLKLAQRHAVTSGPATGRLAVTLDEVTYRALNRLCIDNDCTLFAAMATIYSIILGRLSGQHRLLLGLPWGLRDGLLWEDVAGPFVNTLAVPFDASPQRPFLTALRAARTELLAAQTKALLPFDHLVDAVQPARLGSATPLVQFAFGLHHLDKVPQGGVLVQGGASAKFDGSLVLFADQDNMSGVFEYDRAAVPDSIADKLVQEIVRAAQFFADSPDSSIRDINAAAEKIDASQPEDTNLGLDLGEVVAAHAKSHPEALAIDAHDGTLDYAALDGRSNWLASQLRSRQSEFEARVGVYMGNTQFHPLALLAIQKAGQVYVPLDPALPKDRLARIIKKSSLSLILTADQGSVPGAGGADIMQLDQLEWQTAPKPDIAIDPKQLAYILFTSGSTGEPKGVMIERDGVKNVLAAQSQLLQLQHGDRMLKFASPSFDASIFEMLAALGAGATLCLVPEQDLLPGRCILTLLETKEIDAMFITPSALALVPHQELPRLRLIYVGGEACPADLIARWGHGRVILNLYGPAEGTIWATCAQCIPGEAAPSIGHALPGVKVVIVDEALQPVSELEAGELLIGGVQVSRGYLDDPKQTASAFVPDPAGPPGSRLYRSGDLVRLQPDGTLDFLGRIDDQLKIRGIRIEPREIEAVLLQRQDIINAVVTKVERRSGDSVLVGYLEPAQGAIIDLAAVQSCAAAVLPKPMVPSEFVIVPHMPRTASGKIARNALPVPSLSSSETPLALITDTIERMICDICSDLLSRKVEPSDNFFAVGGHSLLAVKFVSLIEENIGFAPPPIALFECGSLAEFSKILRDKDACIVRIPRLSREFLH